MKNDLNTPEDFIHEIGALELEAAAFEGVEITAENAPALRDVIARGVAIGKRIEAARKDAKKPHLDACKDVDADYKPVAEHVTGIANAAKGLLTPFMVAEQKRQQAEAEEARKKAEALRKDALLSERAEARAVEAEKAAQAPVRIASASGFSRAGSLRTYRSARVIDAAAMVAHFAGHAAVIEAAERLANAAIRDAKGAAINIPGVEVVEEQRVA
jgi:hypothetical protein